MYIKYKKEHCHEWQVENVKNKKSFISLIVTAVISLIIGISLLGAGLTKKTSFSSGDFKLYQWVSNGIYPPDTAHYGDHFIKINSLNISSTFLNRGNIIEDWNKVVLQANGTFLALTSEGEGYSLCGPEDFIQHTEIHWNDLDLINRNGFVDKFNEWIPTLNFSPQIIEISIGSIALISSIALIATLTTKNILNTKKTGSKEKKK